MDRFPEDFNARHTESMLLDEAQETLLKDTRACIYSTYKTMLTNRKTEMIVVLPEALCRKKKEQLVREICHAFPGRVDSWVIDCTFGKGFWGRIDDADNPPIVSPEYKIRF